jgi:hypothetical protein
MTMTDKEIVQYYGQLWGNVKHMKSYVKELRERYKKENEDEITSTRLIYAKDKNDLLQLKSEGTIDEELSLSEEYDEYTFYKINSNGEEMVELLEKDIVNLEETENE